MSLMTVGLVLLVGVLGGALAAVLWVNRKPEEEPTGLEEPTNPETPPGFPGSRIEPVDVEGKSIDDFVPEPLNTVEDAQKSLDELVDEHL